MNGKSLGKIESCKFGTSDAMIGMFFSFTGDGWGVSDFWGDWNIPHSERCQWTEKQRITRLGEMVMRLNTILEQAKCTDIKQLVGKPVEVTFDGNMIKSWRILTEVL